MEFLTAIGLAGAASLVVAGFFFHWTRLVLIFGITLGLGYWLGVIGITGYAEYISPADRTDGVEPLAPIAFALAFLFCAVFFGVFARLAWRLYRLHQADGSWIQPWNAR